MPRILLFCLLMLLPGIGRAENADTLAFHPALQRLKTLGDSLLKGQNDSIRYLANKEFNRLTDSILQAEGSYALSFFQVPSLSVVASSDKKFKLLTWMLADKDGEHYRYFGYLQQFDKRKKIVKTTPLSQQYISNIDSAAFMRLDSSNWMGCIYYKVVERSYNKKTHYILLGWAPNSLSSTRKIVEPLVLSGNKIQFGAPVIRGSGKTKCRLVFEYNSRVTMSLRENEAEKLIVFDHLSPSDPRPEAKGLYSLYGPDLTYDALRFEEGNWLYLSDVKISNTENTEGKEPELKKFRATRKVR